MCFFRTLAQNCNARGQVADKRTPVRRARSGDLSRARQVSLLQCAIAALAALNDVSVEQIYPYRTSLPSPLEPLVVDHVTELAQEFWPGILVIPQMSVGASDAVFTRNGGIPTYGVSAILDNPGDMRAHGQDEGIGIEAFAIATGYWYRLVKRLSSPDS